jgi:hypothetical protein
MNAELESLLSAVRLEGSRRFASWDDALFDAVVRGPVRTLCRGISGQPHAGQVLQAYLRLVQEGVGTAVLRQAAPSEQSWNSFLERCLVQLVPEKLPKVPPGEQLPLLVKVWNLGEGLRREPDWVDRYVNACAGSLGELTELEAFLVRTLEPVLIPPYPSTWQGPFAVQVLDLRPLNDGFLPGAVRLAAPTVLCVPDRRLPGVQAGVLLRHGRQSQLLGLTQGLGEYQEGGKKPGVGFEDRRVTVAGKHVEVPALRRPYHHAVAGAGFVAVAAVDSQRLWILESA